MFDLDKIVPIFAVRNKTISVFSMKIKLLTILTSLFIASLTITSCLDEDNDTELSSEVYISGFSINKIKTVLIEGTDTTTFTVTGSAYPFSIDQTSGKIYNNDSLPYQTDVKKVAVNISAQGRVTYKLKNQNGQDSLCIWSAQDSLDFTNPILFTVYAYDGITTKTYEAKINVHKVKSDALVWNKVENSNFPGISINGKQKAILFNDKIFVYADNETQVQVTYATEATNWSALTSLTGLNAKADYSSVIAFNNKLYIIAGNEVYSSTDGIDWAKEPAVATGLISAFNNKLLGINANKSVEAIYSNGGITWQETEKELPADFPASDYISVTRPLATNGTIEQTVMISGNYDEANDSITVWTIFSNESDWTKYTTDRTTFNCPNLENIALISYDNQLLVFGGKGKDGNNEVKAFQYFYSSKDNGLTWKAITEDVMFPNEFIGKNIPFSYIVDKENYIWIMWSGENIVWKGRINRLGFKN